jgi:hypothetical protein
MQLQDEITGRLARRLDLELTEAESRRAQSERPNNPNAVDLAMRGWSLLNQPQSRELLSQSRDVFEQALRIEPELPKPRMRRLPLQSLIDAMVASGAQSGQSADCWCQPVSRVLFVSEALGPSSVAESGEFPPRCSI